MVSHSYLNQRLGSLISFLQKRKVVFDLPTSKPPVIPIQEEIYRSPLDMDYSREWGLFSSNQSLARLFSANSQLHRRLKISVQIPRSRFSSVFTFQKKAHASNMKKVTISAPPSSKYPWTSEDDCLLLTNVQIFTNSPVLVLTTEESLAPAPLQISSTAVNWPLLAESLNAHSLHNRFRSAQECADRFSWLQEAALVKQTLVYEHLVSEQKVDCTNACNTVSDSYHRMAGSTLAEKLETPPLVSAYPAATLPNVLAQMGTQARHLAKVRNEVKLQIRKQTQQVDKTFVHPSHIVAFNKASNDWGQFDKRIMLPSDLLHKKLEKLNSQPPVDTKKDQVDPLLFSKSQIFPSKLTQMIEVSKLIVIPGLVATDSAKAATLARATSSSYTTPSSFPSPTKLDKRNSREKSRTTAKKKERASTPSTDVMSKTAPAQTATSPYSRPAKKPKTTKFDTSTDLLAGARFAAASSPSIAARDIPSNKALSALAAGTSASANKYPGLKNVMESRPEIKQALMDLVNHNGISQEEKVAQMAKLIKEGSAI